MVLANVFEIKRDNSIFIVRVLDATHVYFTAHTHEGTKINDPLDTGRWGFALHIAQVPEEFRKEVDECISIFRDSKTTDITKKMENAVARWANTVKENGWQEVAGEHLEEYLDTVKRYLVA